MKSLLVFGVVALFAIMVLQTATAHDGGSSDEHGTLTLSFEMVGDECDVYVTARHVDVPTATLRVVRFNAVQHEGEALGIPEDDGVGFRYEEGPFTFRLEEFRRAGFTLQWADGEHALTRGWSATACENDQGLRIHQDAESGAVTTVHGCTFYVEGEYIRAEEGKVANVFFGNVGDRIDPIPVTADDTVPEEDAVGHRFLVGPAEAEDSRNFPIAFWDADGIIQQGDTQTEVNLVDCNPLVASFETPGGNEWWVEVYVDANKPVVRVDALVDGAFSHGLSEREWGAWAASFHVPDGSIVEFRAFSEIFDTERSGQYRWPSGEPVDEGEEPPPPSGDFDAMFHTSGGNQWWVEVNVDANEPLAAVHARDDGGAWIALEKKDWGAWAKSFHVEDGSLVDFRATSTDGDTDISGTYRWPDGTQVTQEPDGEDPPPPSGDFDATFGTSGGNEWWVEVNVDANEPLAAVHARDDGGAWIALDEKSWGAWAKSFHVQDGSLVDFRATSTDGDTVISDTYRWPDGTQVSPEPDGEDPPPPTTTDVAFAPKAGNEWWVETLVVGDGETILTVEGRAGNGAWHALTYREWGAWAASFHVPTGSDVELRATTPTGTDTSVLFTWPDAKPVGSDGSWPEEGSYARYDSFYQGSPGSTGDTFMDHVYHDGEWWFHRYGEGKDPGGISAIENWGRSGPTFGPTDTAPGEFEARERDTHKEGDPVTVAVWMDEHISGCNCDNDYWEWEKATGIYVWKYNSGTSYSTHRLLDSDAPMQTE